MPHAFLAPMALAAMISAIPHQIQSAQMQSPWPAEISGFAAPQSGEHPRLLFRRNDIAKLQERARTPEGQAIIKRLRLQLNGSDGETMPKQFGIKERPAKNGSGPLADAPPGVYTFSHTAGYGLLYVLTGEKKYADLGRQCMERALEGFRDRDQRYSFRAPYGALRAGPSLGWTALGYDLCYNGWDEAFRKQVAEAIMNYNEGQYCSLPELVRGARQNPRSNHWGMQVGGAALALLALLNDPGVDMEKLRPLLATSEKAMLRNLTEGFGDGGFFAEGDGTGSMASHIVFLTAMQAWHNVAGKDFYTPRPNAQWMALKWFFLTLPRNGQMDFPKRGAYPQNIWDRDGLSGGGYFSIGFGLASESQKSGLVWFYNQSGLKALDDKNATPFDTPSPYPHHSVLAFVNWPFGLAEKNPGEVLPHAFRDSQYGFYAWRNRWQDADDVIISILTRTAKGNYSAAGEKSLTIWGLGKKQTWGTITGGFKGDFAPAKDGSTILSTGDGSSLAIDFSKASGGDALLVMTGPGAPRNNQVEAGGVQFSLLLFTKGPPPAPKVEGNKIRMGGQTIGYNGTQIELGVLNR